jgi:hypothetical protein
MTSEILSGWAGVVLSLVFTYLPGVKVRFGGMGERGKIAATLASLLLVSVGVFLLSCGDVKVLVACTKEGALQLFTLFFYAAAGSQFAFVLTPKK